jgi:hypothetical protein
MMKTKMFMQAMLISIAIATSVIFNLPLVRGQTLTSRISIIPIVHRCRLSLALQFGSGEQGMIRRIRKRRYRCCRWILFLPFILAFHLTHGLPFELSSSYGDVIIAPLKFDFDASLWKEKLIKLASEVVASLGFSLISYEQVEQELSLMGISTPSSEEQLHELSKRLKVKACIEIVCSLQRARHSKGKLIICARWFDSEKRLFTHGSVLKCDVDDVDIFLSSFEPPQMLQDALHKVLSETLMSKPIRSNVQLQLQNGLIHIMGGKRAGWKKGMEVAICRRTYDTKAGESRVQVVGRARIVEVETFYAVARPLGERFQTRNPDEAISLFNLPNELSHLAK